MLGIVGLQWPEDTDCAQFPEEGQANSSCLLPDPDVNGQCAVEMIFMFELLVALEGLRAQNYQQKRSNPPHRCAKRHLILTLRFYWLPSEKIKVQQIHIYGEKYWDS